MTAHEDVLIENMPSLKVWRVFHQPTGAYVEVPHEAVFSLSLPYAEWLEAKRNPLPRIAEAARTTLLRILAEEEALEPVAVESLREQYLARALPPVEHPKPATGAP